MSQSPEAPIVVPAGQQTTAVDLPGDARFDAGDAGDAEAESGSSASGDGGAETRPAVKKRSKRSHRRRVIIEWGVILAVAAIVAFLLRVFVVQAFYVPSGSMYPTLQVGDRILVWKLPLFGGVNRGDIVVFRRPPADTSLSSVNDLVKRVVGMPGETISSKGDNIYINGKEIAQPWLPKLTGGCYQPALDIAQTPGAVDGKFHIPANEYYVMGDCRGDSEDSRYFGAIPKSLIVGKVFVVVWRDGHPDIHFL